MPPRRAIPAIAALTCLFFVAAMCWSSDATAAKLPHYPDDVLAEWQQRYPRGIYSNYKEVILPLLSAAQREKLKDLVFEFPPRIEGHEPFGFAADTNGQTIYMSVQSLKFLDEASIAAAWLNRNGYTIESLTNYWLMLRNWKDSDAPPPMLATLCIPADAIADQDVDELSQKIFSTAIFFVMLHEIGHVLGEHGGYNDIAAAVARAREAEADAFALEVMAKVGDAPLGVVNLFLAMTYFSDNSADFATTRAYETNLAQRTHPLSPERLRTFANTIEETAANYSGSGISRVQFVVVAQQIRMIAGTLKEVELLTSLSGQAINPSDLGPMRPGDKIGRSCTQEYSGTQPFSGRFKGVTTVNNVEFDLEAELRRDGDRVTGRSSYGLGFSTIEGVVEDDTLHYRWRLGQQAGRGVLKHLDGVYDGQWINDDPNLGTGMVSLKRR